jgi:hypothetical protein
MAVPKASHIGDRVMFHLPGLRFVARGVIASEPHASKSKSGWYDSDVNNLILLSDFVPLAFIRDNHPQWRWPTYARIYTTIDGAIEATLESLVDDYQASITGSLIL